MKKIVILSYPLHSTPPLGVFPSEYWHPLWDGKTRMVSLPDGEKISMICLFVLTWSTNVTDGRTDRQTLHDSKDRACIASRGKNRRFYVPPPLFFVCPGDAPLTITQNIAWVKRQFSVCQIRRSMYPSIFLPTLSQLFEPQVQKIAVFVSPGDAPVAITQYVAWMERQVNACQTHRSLYLSIFNSFRVSRCLSQCVSPKIAIFTTFLFSLGTPLGQSH